MEKIEFYKMSGSGNDFIIVDNRDKIVDGTDLLNFIVKVCRRKMSVGADGFILVENTEGADFKWRFFNSDGSVAEMCGNGARCVARFAY
ncbi:MAG: diaminopimelate epimerase, partial [Deltaproteobacteria bacterium]|nr:diaminopimelate epimerase [Deltaproteobacteria bacterium]